MASPQKQPPEPEVELMKMKADFEKIKIATGVVDIQDVENRFLEQTATEEKLLDLKKKLAKTLFDLKTEKKQLDSRMELLRGTNAGCPKRELEEELQIADSRLKEQEKRKESAQLESEKINALLLNLEGQMRKLLHLMGKELPDAKISIPSNPTVAELSLKIEETLKKTRKTAICESPEDTIKKKQ
ncbi:uncharacterized protein CDAR_566641 [Caerostris darwini]|uniref:Uncharacterized protein n=1 Tax=Caerostris darwini TaxID=1538125 RepID=A0AAV4X471_9ARAC|nr:uncharacterized protein CDAR_566641 [Caerostris darwini]